MWERISVLEFEEGWGTNRGGQRGPHKGEWRSILGIEWRLGYMVNDHQKGAEGEGSL